MMRYTCGKDVHGNLDLPKLRNLRASGRKTLGAFEYSSKDCVTLPRAGRIAYDVLKRALRPVIPLVPCVGCVSGILSSLSSTALFLLSPASCQFPGHVHSKGP